MLFRSVDDRARPAARVARVQRGDRGVGREHAGQVVGDRDPDPHRRLIRIAGQDFVVAGIGKVKPVRDGDATVLVKIASDPSLVG